MAKSRLDPKKCIDAVQTIHYILYLDGQDKGNFQNVSQERNAVMLAEIADVVAGVIPRLRKSIECVFCHKKVAAHTIHIDRDGDFVCDACWDERLR